MHLRRIMYLQSSTSLHHSCTPTFFQSILLVMIPIYRTFEVSVGPLKDSCFFRVLGFQNHLTVLLQATLVVTERRTYYSPYFHPAINSSLRTRNPISSMRYVFYRFIINENQPINRVLELHLFRVLYILVQGDLHQTLLYQEFLQVAKKSLTSLYFSSKQQKRHV